MTHEEDTIGALKGAFLDNKITSFVFIMDYFQMVFEDYARLSIYSLPKLYDIQNKADIFNNSGSLASMIGETITDVSLSDGFYDLKLSNDQVFRVQTNPEDYDFAGAIDSSTIVKEF